jgi:putative membrane protein
MRCLGSLAVIVAAAAVCGAAAQSRDPVPVETRHGTRPAPPPATASVRPKDGADVAFLRDALDAALAETYLGDLAQQRSQNAAVRAYGKTLAADHSNAAQEIKEILGTLNVTAEAEPTPETQSRHADLAELSGPDFDAAFLSLAIAAHEEALETYRAQTQANPDEELALFAAKALPTLEAHLAAAKALQLGR